MKLTTKIISAVFAISLVFGFNATSQKFVPVALAQTSSAKTIVDKAKADRLIGERIDGYLGAVNEGVPVDVQSAMNEINIRRKSVYTRLARSQSVSVEVVAKLSGEKLTAKARSGQMIMLQTGVWTAVG